MVNFTITNHLFIFVCAYAAKPLKVVKFGNLDTNTWATFKKCQIILDHPVCSFNLKLFPFLLVAVALEKEILDRDR